MSDRINSFTVVLNKDYKDEDAEQLLNAFKQFKGVISVTPNISNVTDHVAQSRARNEMISKMLEAFQI